MKCATFEHYLREILARQQRSIGAAPPPPAASATSEIRLTLAQFARWTGEAASARWCALLAANPRPVSCAAGCAHCCRQLIAISPAEAWLLDDWLQSLPISRREYFESRIQQIAKMLENGGGPENCNSLLRRIENLSDPDFDAAGHFQLACEYAALTIPCPFLENEMCACHEIRPIVCREYWVYSPASDCRDPARGIVERAEGGMDLSEMLSGVCAQLRGMSPQRIALPLAISWACAHSFQRDGHWSAHRLVERLIAQMHCDSES